ncbi:MAG: hypothetical protein ABMA13_21105 [Chthoniobacteraceae bacterium]
MKLILAALALTATLASAAPITDAAAFAKLKTLKGTWDGPEMPGMGKLRTTYRTIAAGSAVIETCFAGTKNEMVSLYTLNSRGRLVMTHYCTLGNQPHCTLDTKRSTDTTLVFKFDGGENIKTTAMHMRGMTLEFAGANKIVCGCESFKDGKSAGAHSSTLRRVK